MYFSTGEFYGCVLGKLSVFGTEKLYGFINVGWSGESCLKSVFKWGTHTCFLANHFSSFLACTTASE